MTRYWARAQKQRKFLCSQVARELFPSQRLMRHRFGMLSGQLLQPDIPVATDSQFVTKAQQTQTDKDLRVGILLRKLWVQWTEDSVRPTADEERDGNGRRSRNVINSYTFRSVGRAMAIEQVNGVGERRRSGGTNYLRGTCPFILLRGSISN